MVSLAPGGDRSTSATAPRRSLRRRDRRAAPHVVDVAVAQRPTASPRSPAGHGRRPRIRGPRRSVAGDRPVPASSWVAHNDAVGDVSTAASAHTVPTSSGRARGDRRHGNAGQPGAVGIGDRLDDSRLVGDEHLGDQLARRPRLHPRDEAVDVDARARRTAGGRSAPGVRPRGTDAGSISPLVTSGAPDAVVGHRGHQAVVLVAEVGVERGPLAERPVGAQRPAARARRASAVTTSVHGRPRSARGGAPPRTRSRTPRRRHRTSGSATTTTRPAGSAVRPRPAPDRRRARRAPTAGSTRPIRPPGATRRAARARNSTAASA